MKINKNKRDKNAKTHTHTHSPQIKNMEFILCWPVTPDYGTCPGLWLIYTVTLHWRKFSFLACINCKWLLS